MTDFAIDGGSLDRVLGQFGKQLAHPGKHKGHSKRGGPFHRADDAPLFGQSLNLKPFFEVLEPKSELAPSSVPAGVKPAKAAQVEEQPAESSADRLVNGYLNFLKGLVRDPSAGTDPEQLQEQVDRLVKVVTNPLGIKEEDIESLSISSELNIAQAYAAYAAQGENGIEGGFAATYAASAHLTADIVTKDGRSFHVNLSIEVEQTTAAAFAVQQNQADPLVLDLNGDGVFNLSDIENGVDFDINADGLLDRSAFVAGPDAFLALDRNENGVIDDGSELFGDQHGAANGFEELKNFDADENGQIDENDPVYGRLLALQRGEGGRFAQASLAQLSIYSLSLSYERVTELGQGGNTISERSTFERASANYALADALLGYRTLSKDA